MDPNLDLNNNLGCKELILKKLSYAVTCSVVMQIVILTAFLFVVNFNIFNPGAWVISSLSTWTSFSTWLFVVPFLSAIFAQSLICAKDYVLKPTCSPTRIRYFLSMFSLRNLILLSLHLSSGGLFVWLYLSLSGGELSNLFVKCRGGYCLDEQCFYLVLFGVLIGLYYFVNIYNSERNIIFPVVQQKKLLQFKSNLISIAKSSQQAAILPVIYYVILNFFFGASLHLPLNNFVTVRANVRQSLFMIFYAWCFGTLYIFNMKLMRFFFEIFLTEPVEFPLIKMNISDLALTDAMNINNVPIIQHLACLDLYLLSTSSRSRRALIFSLSQPGNHPHYWNNLIENVLRILTEYTQTMNVAISTILSADQDKHVEEKKPTQTTNPFIKNYNYGNMRNMSLQNFNMPLEFVNITYDNTTPLDEVTKSLSQKVKEKLDTALTVVKKKTGIQFLFEELPISNIQYLLNNGQVIIWTVQGLSTLTVSSLKEDKFGVVQKDLPVILSTLVDLRQSMEKLNRLPTLARKNQRFDAYTNKMKYSINSAVKRSLYNICNGFGAYLKDLPLNNEVSQHLQPFIHQ